MHIAIRLGELVYPPAQQVEYHFDDFVDIGPGCFGTSDRKIVSWEGENYVPQRPSLRVRLHNWLIRVGSREPVDLP